MKSLRVQLLVGTALGTTAVLLVSGAMLYALISRVLWTEFDDLLAVRARSLTALAEQDQDGLEFELTEVSLPEFEPGEHAQYYQVWLPDGTVFARSPSLLGGDLDRPVGISVTPVFQRVELPNGRPGRIVGITFTPRREYEGSQANPPLTVTLVLARDVVGLQATLAHLRGILIVVCIVAVALLVSVLAWVVHQRLKPIDHLGGQIANVGESDLSARISAAGVPNEMSSVVERLNDLLARLEAAFQRERRFTGDVAHELRTPLAGLRSMLELALSCDRTPEAYRAAMGDCLEIDLHIQRMVENLLHLSRADAGQLEIRHDQVNLSDMIHQCWQPLKEKASARGLGIEWHLNAVGVVETDRDQLRLVIQNILDNAVTYANDGGQISVVTSAEDSAIVLTVSNTGSSLPADNVDRVFDRFWRADSSYHGGDDEAHYGLGLSLCKAVLDQLGGCIEATTSVAGVLTIAFRLPHMGNGRARSLSAGILLPR